MTRGSVWMRLRRGSVVPSLSRFGIAKNVIGAVSSATRAPAAASLGQEGVARSTVGSLPASASSSSSLASPMCWRRRVRVASRSRQRRSRRCSDSGDRWGSASKSMPCLKTAASVSEIVSPLKSFLPVSISQSTTPNAQISERRSAVLPRACSGLMYAAVPMSTPAWVAWRDRVGESDSPEAGALLSSNAFANPKSRILMSPSSET